MKYIKTFESSINHKEYLSWKRKNVSLRGMKSVGEENNAGAMLGSGLYSAALGNKSLAKEYGQVYFVINARPKKPLKFNTLNDWEIWYQRFTYKYAQEHNGDLHYFRSYFREHTTIEAEIIKIGSDGVEIIGREYCYYTPDMTKIKYFRTEEELKEYYINNVKI